MRQRSTALSKVWLGALFAAAVLSLTWYLHLLGRGSTTANAPQRPADWLVLVYMAADNNLAPSARQNLAELERAARQRGAGASRVTVQVQVDHRGLNDWNLSSGTDRLLFGTNALRRWGFPSSKAALIERAGESDSANPGTLNDFLTTASSRLLAQHVLLILWGHGHGVGGLLDDMDSGTAMSLSGLANGLNGFRSDVLALDLCLMQTVEVLEQVAEHADILVGSQTPRAALGWRYGELMYFLEREPPPTPHEVAGWLVEHSGDRGGDFTGSALDLRYAEELDTALLGLRARSSASSSSERADLSSRISTLRPVTMQPRSFDLGQILSLWSDSASPAGESAWATYQRLVLNRASSTPYTDTTGLSISARRLESIGLLESTRRHPEANAAKLLPHVWFSASQ